MRKFRSELIVLFIILGLIAAGCSNPTNNLLDSFTGINIKSGDSGSAEAIFNSSIHTTELQEVKVGEEVVGTGQYKFVDPALLDVPVDPDAVQSDDAGLYVMRTTDITKVIAGYTYTEGEKAGEKVPAGTAAFQKNGNWYVKEISGYESAITGYTYEDATPVAAGTTVLPGGETGYYVKRVTGYEQVFTGNYKYKDGTIVQGKEILGNADTGYYVQNESTGWWPADVDKMKFPAGNGATVTDTFKVGGAATPYTLTVTIGGGNKIANFTFNPEFVGNIRYSLTNTGDPLSWDVLPSSLTDTNKMSASDWYFYAEIYMTRTVQDAVEPVMRNGDPITVDVPVIPVWGNGEPIMVDVAVEPFYKDAGGDNVREAVYEVTEVRDVMGQQEVVSSAEVLSKEFDLTVNGTTVGWAVINVDKASRELTIKFNIDTRISLTPRIKCALNESGTFEGGDFVNVQNREITFSYVPGTKVFIEVQYEFL